MITSCGTVVLWALGAVVLVVCPAQWQEELAPWVRLREGEGHRVIVLLPETTAERLHRKLHQHAQGKPWGYVLLVGDPSLEREAVGNKPPSQDKLPVGIIPQWRKPSVAVARVSQRARTRGLPTDAPYGDWDGDGCPDWPVARWSVQSRQQLRQVVAKTLAAQRQWSESGPGMGMTLWVGRGGFGPLADAAIRGALQWLFQQHLPADVTLCVQEQQRICRPFRLPSGKGGLHLWAYFGHGSPGALCPVPKTLWKASQLLPSRGKLSGTVAGLFCCSTGQMDSPWGACLAEELLRSPPGPVALIAASEVTMPYGHAILGRELLRGLFEIPLESRERMTLGRWFWQAQRRVWQGWQKNDPLNQAMSLAARWLSPNPNLKRERREHVWLFHLLGDPLLVLPFAPKLKVKLSLVSAAPGKTAPATSVLLQAQVPPHTQEVLVQFYRPFRLPARGSLLDLHHLAQAALQLRITGKSLKQLQAGEALSIAVEGLSPGQWQVVIWGRTGQGWLRGQSRLDVPKWQNSVADHSRPALK